jgi:hypothetical protein
MNKTLLQSVSSLEAIKTVTQGQNTRERSYDVVASQKNIHNYNQVYISQRDKTENIAIQRITHFNTNINEDSSLLCNQ